MKKAEKKKIKKNNDKKGTYVTLVLDETGSMASCKNDTIGGYNEYIKKLKKDGKDIVFTLTKFDSNHVTKVHDAIEVKKVPDLNNETYIPGASTPLYDAIGKTINATDEKNRNVVFVILTDGEENASREFSREGVKALIEEKTKKGWTFIYLGANQDAWLAGTSLGIMKANVKNYSVDDTSKVFGAIARSTTKYSAQAMNCSHSTMNFFEQDENNPNLVLKDDATLKASK